MASPFLGQVTMFAGNFAPRGWAKCDGQLLQISSYSALFSLLGTTYGGDGRVTFGLPDLRSRSPMHWGHGPGLSNRTWGQKAGRETSQLAVANVPPLPVSVSIKCNTGNGNQASPAAHYPAVSTEDVMSYNTAENAVMAPGIISGSVGGTSQAFTTSSPFQTVTFIIALTGVFPSRN